MEVTEEVPATGRQAFQAPTKFMREIKGGLWFPYFFFELNILSVIQQCSPTLW